MSWMKVTARTALTIALALGAFLYMGVPVEAATAVALPVRIIIPTAKVNAPVIPVGVTPTGQLGTPSNFVQAGWYKGGVLPGQIGSAVIDGHVDNGAKIPGPFKNLKNVKIGDTIEVSTVASGTLRFRVIRTDVYKTQDFPSQQIFHDNSAALLKIITCHGQFIASKKTYDKRLVVTAILDNMYTSTSSVAFN